MAEEPDETRPLSKEEREEEFRTAYAYLQPSPIFVDHYTAGFSSRDQMLRITFGEWIGGDHAPIYRLGIVMPVREARRLHRTLTRYLDKEDERLAKVDLQKNLLLGEADGD